MQILHLKDVQDLTTLDKKVLHEKTTASTLMLILDICYRYYPKIYFPKIWELISLAVVARQIKFLVVHQK